MSGKKSYLFQMKRGTVFPVTRQQTLSAVLLMDINNSQVKSERALSEGNFEVFIAPQTAAL